MSHCRLCGGSEAGEQKKALLKTLAEVAGNQAAIQSLTKNLVQTPLIRYPFCSCVQS